MRFAAWAAENDRDSATARRTMLLRHWKPVMGVPPELVCNAFDRSSCTAPWSCEALLRWIRCSGRRTSVRDRKARVETSERCRTDAREATWCRTGRGCGAGVVAPSAFVEQGATQFNVSCDRSQPVTRFLPLNAKPVTAA